MSALKIALTGGIACGKSSVSQIFKKLGVPIIDLDVIARTVVETNTQGLVELVAHFGNGILNDDQTLNRQALRQQLFKNSENQQVIEEILHPKILEKMQTDIEKLNTQLVIVEVPLLVEQNLSHLFDRAIVVDCSEENQLKRLLKREKLDEKLAKTMIATQASREQRLALSEKLPTDILENNSEIFEMEQKVQDLAKKLLNL
ncbi:MAG TPA: dephospho-CoA kinase [Gammaproteobacteria bacterium]|jgi:dephospho-CoA kinase|nr:dephospho-CoA kinase [Gammaproteobacteria bacterium]HBA25464.1 dephospho-CoA kinase [Gammaproteobacteria bacterium]HBQ24248.1 dephospho-CoA kinase [Gammaproteobacteria bacterium]HBW07128.1 dephospho-CoA kinase [Gammaproteobacteria bacterium]HCF48450.1 dephospho-CoA kinase [Gammaproteobacteria bacterium]